MIECFRAEPKDIPPLSSGPLEEHVASFATHLARQHYCRQIARRKLRLVAQLNRWLSKRRIPLVQVDEALISTFLEARRKIQRPGSGDRRTLSGLLHYLRTTGVAPVRRLCKACSCFDQIVQDYEHFLIEQRCLAAGSIPIYASVVKRFLKHRFPDGRIRLRELRADAVTGFVRSASLDYALRTLQSSMSSLRSFLRFLLQCGRISIPLANAVPTVAAGHSSELPKYLEPAQVEKLLKSCDRRRNRGRRDHAILLLLARLALRAGEVAQLCLEDIDCPSVNGKEHSFHDETVTNRQHPIRALQAGKHVLCEKPMASNAVEAQRMAAAAAETGRVLIEASEGRQDSRPAGTAATTGEV